MENQDIKHKELAEKIESLILSVCKCRQENSEVPQGNFHRKCLNRELSKKRMDSIGYIYEYLQKHSYWKYSIDNEQFMTVFDECLKKYQPQGKSFLNFFIKRYSLRMQSAKGYVKSHKDYVDEKDGIYNDSQVESYNDATYDKDDNPNKSMSHLDKKVEKNYQEKEQSSGISTIYECAVRMLGKDDLAYFRYYITAQLLLIYAANDRQISSVDQANWGDDIAILFSEKITDEKLFPFIDLDFFYEQRDLTPGYLEELQQAKDETGKKLQVKAYLKEKYNEKIASRLGMESTRMRTKEKKRLDFISEMREYLHIRIPKK